MCSLPNLPAALTVGTTEASTQPRLCSCRCHQPIGAKPAADCGDHHAREGEKAPVATALPPDEPAARARGGIKYGHLANSSVGPANVVLPQRLDERPRQLQLLRPRHPGRLLHRVAGLLYRPVLAEPRHVVPAVLSLRDERGPVTRAAVQDAHDAFALDRGVHR